MQIPKTDLEALRSDIQFALMDDYNPLDLLKPQGPPFRCDDFFIQVVMGIFKQYWKQWGLSEKDFVMQRPEQRRKTRKVVMGIFKQYWKG